MMLANDTGIMSDTGTSLCGTVLLLIVLAWRVPGVLSDFTGTIPEVGTTKSVL